MVFYISYIARGLYYALTEIHPRHSALNRINLEAISIDQPCFIGEKSVLPIVQALYDVGFYYSHEIKWLAEQARGFIGKQGSLHHLRNDSLAIAFRNYIINAPTLGDFIVRLIENATYTNRSMSFGINKRNDYAEIRFYFNNKERSFNSGCGPLFFISYCTQMLFGTDVIIDSYFEGDSIFDCETYRTYVSGDVRFDKCNYLRIKVDDFNRINDHHNPYIDSDLKLLLDNLKPKEPVYKNISFEVSSKIKQSFMENNKCISSDEIADQLNMSKSSLYRKLEAENTSFRELVEASRKELAIKLISENKFTLGEVSYMLGYSNPTAFNRAFRRWKNVNPSEYKRSLGV